MDELLRKDPLPNKNGARGRRKPHPAALDPALIQELTSSIEAALKAGASSANLEMRRLYVRIGRRLEEHTANLSMDALGEVLESRFGRAFSPRNLRTMLQVARAFPGEKGVDALLEALSWSHLCQLVVIKDPELRADVVQSSIREGWGMNALTAKIRALHGSGLLRPLPTRANLNPPRKGPMEGLVERVSLNGHRFWIDAEDAPVVDRLTWTGGRRGGYLVLSARFGESTLLLQFLLLGERPGPDLRCSYLDRDTSHYGKENLAWLPISVILHRRELKRKSANSPYRGVQWDRQKKKWQARLGKKQVDRFLGRYETAEEAALAYDREARRVFGDYAALNLPEPGEALPPGTRFETVQGPLHAADGQVIQVNPEDLPLLARHRWRPAPEGFIAQIGLAEVPLSLLVLGPLPGPNWRLSFRDGDPRNYAKGNARYEQAPTLDVQRHWAASSTKRLLGVKKHRDRYHARFYSLGQEHHLGSFATPEEAAEAYDRKVLEVFGPEGARNAEGREPAVRPKQRVRAARPAPDVPEPAEEVGQALLRDLRRMAQALLQAESTGSEAVMVWQRWRIGQRILRERKTPQVEAWLPPFLGSLAKTLRKDFGPLFSASKLQEMVRFADLFAHSRPLASLATGLSWAHFRRLFNVPDSRQRVLLARRAVRENWTPVQLGRVASSTTPRNTPPPMKV